jgi:nucleoid-associated protein YgaU
MSTSFRVFLLILASGGALWAYRSRSTDIRHWLRTAPPGVPARGSAGDLMSPVNRVLDPDATQAWVWFHGKDRAPPPRVPEQSPELTDPAYEPSLEDELLAADMPAVDGFASGGAEEDPDLEGAAPSAPSDQGGPGAPPEGPSDGRENELGGGPEPSPPPAPPGLESYEEVTHVLQAGESLWSVAARFLGSGARYKEIRELNRDVIPDGAGDVVPAGTPLKIRLSSREKGLKPADPPNDTSVEERYGPRPREGEHGPASLLHTVRKDENLQRIARKYFPNDRDGWRVLYDANQDRLPSPDRLREGQVLRIPSPSR